MVPSSWRATVKRDFGLDRTRIDGLAGARTWCGHGIFAHNLVKISGLIESSDNNEIATGSVRVHRRRQIEPGLTPIARVADGKQAQLHGRYYLPRANTLRLLR